MPAFVPVFDPEVPRSEQDPNSDKLIKHRKWDNPYVVLPNNKSEDKDRKAFNRTYYKDKYNDNNNKDNKRDNKFYRKNVYDEFDYVAPRKKKSIKSDKSDNNKVVKAIKKEHVKVEHRHR